MTRRVPPFEDGADSKIFRFTYGGEARPLKAYLLERYAYGRDATWRESFYPDRVRLDGAAVDEDTWVHPGARLAYLHLREEEPPAPTLGPPLYADEWMVVLHKPDTVPVNPSGVYYFTSLAVLARETLADPELTPVHRLDLETAGPVVLARRRADASRFHQLFHEKAIRKRYRALVHGAFPAATREIAGRIVPHPASAIATKLWLEPGRDPGHSLTRVRAVRGRPPYSELELEPVTGKTNQLRVHLAALGHPIVGDKKYHPDERVFLDWLAHRDFARLREALVLPRQALQCEALEFPHPFTEHPVRVEALPGSWAAKLGPLAPAP
jgi:23S rRNA pseudouridine1911/1915/1917 synthase